MLEVRLTQQKLEMEDRESTCEATTSVSKGCFVFKSKKRRKPLYPGDYFIPESKSETSQDCKLRYETGDTQWELINDDIESLQADVNKTLFDDLLNFIKNAQAGFRLDQDLDTSRTRSRLKEIPTAAFVTGVNVTDHHDVFTKLASVFQERVSPHVVCLMSRDCTTLKGLMGSVVSQLMGIEYMASEDEDTMPEVNMKKVPCTFPVLQAWYKDNVQKRKLPGSTATFKSPRRSRKRRSMSGPVSYPECPPIIIVLEDFEGFKAVVIQDFIHICSQYLEKLPLVLTFGIATSVTVIHRLLPQSVSSCLSIEKFQAQPSSIYLSKVIDKVLLTAKHPLKLGSKVFQLLLDLFLYHDFSVMNFVQGLQVSILKGHIKVMNFVQGLQVSILKGHIKVMNFVQGLQVSILKGHIKVMNFVQRLQVSILKGHIKVMNFVQGLQVRILKGHIKVMNFVQGLQVSILKGHIKVMNFVQGLQYAVLDHYFSQPLSILCCRYGDAINRTRNLSHDQLELFRQASSFRRYVDGRPASDQRALLLDDKHMKKTLQELLKQMNEYHKAFFPVLECLHILSEGLPYHPLGKQMRELFAMATEGDIFATEAYQEAFKFMKMLARDELIKKMTMCEESLSRCEGLQEARFQLETLQAKMETLGDTCNQPVEIDSTEDDEEEVDTEGSKQNEHDTEETNLRGRREKTTLHSLQQMLMSNAKKKRRMTPYEILRNEILDFFDALFREYLPCPKNLPLHEVFYYNNVSEIRQRLNAPPRAAIQTALSNPNYYLQNPDCETLEEGITSSLPDVCIVYKLHLECGRLINIYDWLQV
ncbi:origin recognition complex subunit 3 isoform X3 [Strongylocentrotus purpuratus]|uniref:Origin recognition complex subunit 3 n=1 Tax=Strongylocentrotus purpuratus TaxID=7668 RepID=A0A7M7PII5_STRPU|nr:origin recognition complex subunit 3 isoform X3 [Strongylocentrotus purpuratus]